MQRVLDDLLVRAVEQGDVPGATAVVVDRDGVVYEGSAGERVAGEGADMSLDTVGAIFSMTKALTGTAAMQLVEQGRLDLDADAGDVCPELANPVVLDGFDADGAPITRPAASPITLRQLLAHTSGFAYEMWNADYVRYLEATGTPSIRSLQKAALRVPLMFDPGTRWEYGIGIDWVGQMVEQVTGTTLGAYLAEHVTGPLGMTDTAFARTPSMLERSAKVHVRGPDGGLTPIDLPEPPDAEFETGGGGLHGTMPDYARFVRMLLNDGQLDGARVLAPDTVELMSQPHTGTNKMRRLPTQSPVQTNDMDVFPGIPKSWGLTFLINDEPLPTGRPAGALMWGGLANSYYWIDREHGIGGCYLSQVLPFADERSLATYLALETAAYAHCG